MSRKARWAVAAGAAVLALGSLVATAFGAGVVYYLTVEELQAHSDELAGRSVRVAGYVAPGSLERPALGLEMRFRLQPRPGEGTAIPVVYRGTPPDLMAEGVEVIAEGRWQEGVLYARQVLVKCPSKYEAAP